MLIISTIRQIVNSVENSWPGSNQGDTWRRKPSGYLAGSSLSNMSYGRNRTAGHRKSAILAPYDSNEPEFIPSRHPSPCLGSVDVTPWRTGLDFPDCHYITVSSPAGGVGGFRSVNFNAFRIRRASGQPPLTPRRSGRSSMGGKSGVSSSFRARMMNCRVGKGRPAGSIELRVSPSPSKIPYGGFSPVRLHGKSGVGNPVSVHHSCPES